MSMLQANFTHAHNQLKKATKLGDVFAFSHSKDTSIRLNSLYSSMTNYAL